MVVTFLERCSVPIESQKCSQKALKVLDAHVLGLGSHWPLRGAIRPECGGVWGKSRMGSPFPGPPGLGG